MATSPLGDIAPPDFPTRRGNVLVVDDDEDMAGLVTTYLEQELPKMEFDAVTDPETALERLHDRGYDCVVSDYDMPEHDGLEFLRRIRDNDFDTPFVLFTGKGSEEIASDAVSAGVDEYLQKGGTEQYPILANSVETLIEKHWAEQQVHRGYRAIEAAQEGIGIIGPDGTYEYLNPAYADIYGVSRESLLGESWERLYPADEIARFRDDVLPEVEATGNWEGSARGRTAAGEPVPERLVVTQMEDGGHVCLVQDLSERDSIEDELAMKERAMNAASIGITISDPSKPDNPLVYVNDGFEDLTGYDSEDAVGRNCRFLQGDDTDPADVERLRNAVDNEESTKTEILNYRANGEPFWNLLEISPVRDTDGDVLNFVGFQREITKRKVRKDEIREQLAWLSGFGHVLSHDLKTPIAVIRGNIEHARDIESLEPLDDAEDALDRLVELIDDLADVMKEGDLVNDLEVVSLDDVFRSWDSFNRSATALEIVDSKRVLADEHALIRLADNLVKNTIEHAGEDAEMRVGALDGGFYYEDTGPGVPEAEREDVFQPGFTTKPDGTGFGMVSIKQIAMAHGWSISLTESADGGVRFEFTDVTEPTNPD
jgi:PAS domain S-box-containing protein